MLCSPLASSRACLWIDVARFSFVNVANFGIEREREREGGRESFVTFVVVDANCFNFCVCYVCCLAGAPPIMVNFPERA